MYLGFSRSSDIKVAEWKLDLEHDLIIQETGQLELSISNLVTDSSMEQS